MRSKNEFATTGRLRLFGFATFFTALASAADDICVQPNSTISSQPIIIKNPVLEEFGEWGQWDACPKGTFVAGLQVRYEYALWGELRTGGYFDNTALNGIRVYCSKVGENRFTTERPMSAVGRYGVWFVPFFCDIGVVNGFQVRHAIYYNDTLPVGRLKVDNVGAVNVRIHCVKTENRLVWMEGGVRDPQEVYSWSNKFKNPRLWTEKQFCGPGQAVTAIRTQVDQREKVDGGEDSSKTIDVRGLTNIEMRCENVLTALDTCKPKLFYQQLIECNNIKGTSPLSCRYENKVGTEQSKTDRKSESNEISILGSLGVDAEVKVGGFYTKMSAKVSAGVDNGDTSVNETSEFWQGETISAATVTVPPNRVQRIFQVFGSCGDTEVRTSRIIVDERAGDVPNPIPKTGFVCNKPSKVRGGRTRKFKHFKLSNKTYTKDEF